MGNRLSKIYTRTGDGGSTGLGDGVRVDKDSARVEAIGTVDELNSAIGMVLTFEMPADVDDCLTDIQHDLFDLGAELSMPGHSFIEAARTAGLEQALDDFNEDLPYLKEFILPGGSPAAAACHFARTVCRRAERRVVTLGKTEEINPQLAIYLNRLSDLLFVLALLLCRADGFDEVLWNRER
jgi:cob(I)alamin adenosyltransferase